MLKNLIFRVKLIRNVGIVVVFIVVATGSGIRKRRRGNEKMGKKHDAIVRSLTEEKILTLTAEKIYGKKQVWGFESFLQIVNKDFEDIPIKVVKDALNIIFEKNFFDSNSENMSFGDLKIKLKAAVKDTTNLDLSNCCDVFIRYEWPIIKGEGQYMTTKGHIDLVVDIKPKSIVTFKCFANDVPNQLIIEVKKLKDFEDTGSIIRQLNEYKQYYYLNPPFSNIFNKNMFRSNCYEDVNNSKNTFWIVYCDEDIPLESKQMLEKAGYIPLSG